MRMLMKTNNYVKHFKEVLLIDLNDLM